MDAATRTDGVTVNHPGKSPIELHGRHATAYLLENGFIDGDDPEVLRILNGTEPPAGYDPAAGLEHAVGAVVPHHHHADGSAHPSHSHGTAFPPSSAHVPASRTTAADCPDCH